LEEKIKAENYQACKDFRVKCTAMQQQIMAHYLQAGVFEYSGDANKDNIFHLSKQ